MPLATLDAADLDSFLARMCAEPEERTHRLVLADWLQDRDDGRAEYVRWAEPADVLTLLYPPVDEPLDAFPTYSTDGTGPRAANFGAVVRLFPLARPLFRLRPSGGGRVRLVGRKVFSCDYGVGDRALIRVDLRRSSGVLLLTFETAPGGVVDYPQGDTVGDPGGAIELWAAGAGPAGVRFYAPADEVGEG